MKTSILALLGTFPVATVAFAHEHAAGGGLFGLPPEYVHVLLNPLPLYGMAMGLLALIAALVVKNKTSQSSALGLILLASASAWPVFHYGQNAYKDVRSQVDEVGQDWLDEHMDRAEKLIYGYYLIAALATAALCTKRHPKISASLTYLTLLGSIASLGFTGWISYAGGKVRHSEFRLPSPELTEPGHQIESNHH